MITTLLKEIKAMDLIIWNQTKAKKNQRELNSTDKSKEIAISKNVNIFDVPEQGKGNVVRRMFQEIDAECYIMVDGDDTYPAEEVNKLINPILEGRADMAIGDRLSSTYYRENKRPFHNFGNNLVRDLINFLFNSDINDIMTGYRAFSYLFVKTFPVLSKGFEIETEMTIHAVDKNMYVENIVIEYRDRPEGSVSKLDTYSDGFKVLKTIVKLYKNYRPLRFFIFLAIVLAIVSLILFVPVFATFIQTGLVPRIPTLIVSGFFGLAALISVFCGLILDTLICKNKQDFEFQMQCMENRYRNLK